MNGTTRRPWAPRRCRRTIDGGRPRLAWISDDRDDGRKCPCLRCRREPALEGTRHWGHPISSGGLARRCLVVDVRRPNLLPAPSAVFTFPLHPHPPPPPTHPLFSLCGRVPFLYFPPVLSPLSPPAVAAAASARSSQLWLTLRFLLILSASASLPDTPLPLLPSRGFLGGARRRGASR